ncbi:MAG: hypothetical protein QOK14_1210 [Frankiaceae bacterium]|jgi:uncharacterized membrane protein|nr:hypothetical protein [Frankiaceae bacterium]
MRRARLAGDAGTVIPLIIGFILVVSLLLLVVIDATVLFLASRSIGTYADGAALAAAQEINKQTLYSTGGIVDNSLLPIGQTAQDAAERYLLDAHAAVRFPGVSVVAAVNAANEVTVTVTAPHVLIPFTNLVGLPVEESISNTATAVLRCGEGAANVSCAAG